MEKIHIFTDSAADIPRSEAERYGIEILPITITHEGRAIREYYDISPEAYWEMLETASEIPQTAQVTPTQFLDTYRRAYDRGCTHVLGVLINGKGSGTLQSARMARNLFYQEVGEGMTIEVIDSATYTYIYGHIVVRAAMMREEGERFDAICNVVHNRLNRVEAYLGVYSLRHLKKSGRISGGAAFVGEALGLKPISHVYNGAVHVCDKVRGEKALVTGILKNVQKRAVEPDRQTALLLYGAVEAEKIEALAQTLIHDLGFQDVVRYPIGVSVITNTGPKALAVAFYGKPRDCSNE